MGITERGLSSSPRLVAAEDQIYSLLAVRFRLRAFCYIDSMTWTINLSGHDDLSGDEKAALEQVIVGEATGLYHTLKAQKGIKISTATVNTNTTGATNLLDS